MYLGNHAGFLFPPKLLQVRGSLDLVSRDVGTNSISEKRSIRFNDICPQPNASAHILTELSSPSASLEPFTAHCLRTTNLLPVYLL